MRVLHVSAGNLYGGIETLLVTLARHRVLCPAMEPHFALCFEGRLSEELAATGVAVHMLGQVRISRPWTVWRARHRLRKLLRQERFDVLVCHGFWPHVIFAPVAKSQRTPLVFWASNPPTGRHWLERWARRTEPDLIVACSRLIWSAVPCLFRDVPGEVLYCPVSAGELPDRNRIRRDVRAALQIPENATVIVQCSRLERWKGHALLLQALDRLQGIPNWVYWIAGGAQRLAEFDYLEELKATAARMGLAGRVRFLGQRSDVPRLLAAADVHCQPNTGPEPFGITFIEALYAGLPVVTTALGGALEIVDDTCGRLVRPGDPDALADTLRRLIEDKDLRTVLGAAGPARARELCDPVTQLRRLYGFLSICSKGRNGGPIQV